MPKPQEEIWNHWIPTEGNDRKLICRYCLGAKQIKHSAKCKRHTSIYPSTTEAIRIQYKTELLSSKLKHCQEVKSLRASKSAPLIHLSEEEGDELNSSYASTNCLSSFVNKIGKTAHRELEILFAKAMMAGNVPFSWINNYHLTAFFEKLGSGFIPPSRRELSGSILKHLNEESLKEVSNQISAARSLAIVPDGWQNVRGTGVINIMLANTTSCIFYSSFETGILMIN